MKMWQLHQTIEALGLREHGDKNVVVDIGDGRYAKLETIETFKDPRSNEVVLRIR